MRDLLRLFSNFFTNCVELNLWLTRVIVELCACRYRSAEGWLLFKPEDGYLETSEFINTLVPENHTPSTDNLLVEFSDLQDSSSDESDDFKLDSTYLSTLSKKKPTFTRFPQLFTMLKTLRAQIAHYKSELADDDFENLLEERRRALGFLDGISSAMNTAHITPSRHPRIFITPTMTPSRHIESRSSSSSSLIQAPFSAHFERTRKFIQPLFPMGLDLSCTSLENSGSEVEEKHRTGEFEPPDEISMGRLLNNIIVFEV
jgi:hypothetical protein